MSDVAEQIRQTVESNDVVLFMKGTPEAPQCGFSSKVSQILGYCGIDYTGVNVLESDDLRQGIKTFSDWPTIPQLYVKGEFVGGCDIIVEMALSGEFDSMLEEKGVAFNKEAAETIRSHNN